MANPFRKFARAVKSALKSFHFPGLGGGGISAGYGGLYSFMQSLLPGSGYDYQREAGNVLENSIVLSCMLWIIQAYAEMRLVVEATDGDDNNVIERHPLVQLLENPNPDYDGETLMAGVLISKYWDGNAYIYIDRSLAGKAVNLYYIPHVMIEPGWNQDGREYIGYYTYTVDGVNIPIPVKNIIHIKEGIDPFNTRKGLSRLRATLREICTDNEAGGMVAALLRNMGIPGVWISPSASAVTDDDGAPMMSSLAAQKIQSLFVERFGGERRGEPFVGTFPMDIKELGFDPQKLLLDKIRNIPEERITAVIGVPPGVVGMGTGLDNNTYSNFEQGVKIAYMHSVKPTGRRICNTLTHKFRNEPGFEIPDGYRLGYDCSAIMALQPDFAVEEKRAIDKFKGGLLTRNEARRLVKAEPVDNGNLFIESYKIPKALPKPPVEPEDDDITDSTPDEEENI